MLFPVWTPSNLPTDMGRITEVAVASVTHLVSKHLENPKSYAQVLFVDFSSASNTVLTLPTGPDVKDMHVHS